MKNPQQVRLEPVTLAKDHSLIGKHEPALVELLSLEAKG
ncbi:hypothetical protein SynMITS9220_01987 [Synechococcus sp. MIT S9220]|nr:hypothetical protein SynMITS9220_01987 [Synechococcus sp. MIT S9220]